MADCDIALMAHLMRRAGFGATRDELEAYVAKGYEETVGELLNTDDQPPWNEDIFVRAYPDMLDRIDPTSCQARWAYRMINTLAPWRRR